MAVLKVGPWFDVQFDPLVNFVGVFGECGELGQYVGCGVVFWSEFVSSSGLGGEFVVPVGLIQVYQDGLPDCYREAERVFYEPGGFAECGMIVVPHDVISVAPPHSLKLWVDFFDHFLDGFVYHVSLTIWPQPGLGWSVVMQVITG